MQITAKTNDEKIAPVTIEVNIPDGLEAKVKLFGQEVIDAAATKSLVIDAQAAMRRMMVPKTDKDGKVTEPASTAAQIQAFFKDWKPGVRAAGPRVSAFDKAVGAVASFTPEQRAALLKQLQAAK